MNIRNVLKCAIGFLLLGFFAPVSVCSQDVRIQRIIRQKAQARREAVIKFSAQQKAKAALAAQEKQQAWRDAIAKLEARKEAEKKAMAKVAAQKQQRAQLVQSRAQSETKNLTTVISRPPHTHTVTSYWKGFDGSLFPSIKYMTCWNNPCYK